MDHILAIHLVVSDYVWEKFVLYYPDLDSIWHEVARQIGESKDVLVGNNVTLKFVPYSK